MKRALTPADYKQFEVYGISAETQWFGEHHTFMRIARDPKRWLDSGSALETAAHRLRCLDLASDGIGPPRMTPVLGPDGSPAGEVLMHDLDAHVFQHYHAMIPVYYMLSGMAVECFAKGVIVTIDPKRVRLGYIAMPWTSARAHDITSLLQLADVSLQAEEISAANKLTEYVRWRGRYPTPLVLEEVSSLGRLGEFTKLEWLWKVEALVAKVKCRLAEAIAARGDSAVSDGFTKEEEDIYKALFLEDAQVDEASPTSEGDSGPSPAQQANA